MIWYLRQKRAINNIADADRPRLVSSAASELGTSADRTNFSDVFHRVKEIRGYVSQSACIESIDADTIRLTKQFAVSSTTQRNLPPLTVRRDTIENALHEARWIAHHAQYIVASSGLTVNIYLGDREIEYLEPPARGVDP